MLLSSVVGRRPYKADQALWPQMYDLEPGCFWEGPFSSFVACTFDQPSLMQNILLNPGKKYGCAGLVSHSKDFANEQGLHRW